MREYGVVLLALVLLAGRGESPAPAGAQEPASQLPQKLASAHLPNLVRVHPQVISGGLPEGEAAFAELKDLGVRTIISVDGAVPDVETAARFGLAYVHLPHGYDGIPESRVRELAKAVRELQGPIYIHCHHGRHRSPAAASAACVAAGLIAPDDAVSVLELAGTSRDYQGLYDSVRACRPIPAAELDGLAVEFRPRLAIPPVAEAMVALERTHDRLKKLAENEWQPLANDPDLDPAHEALLLREHFAELLRLEETPRRSAEFLDVLRDSRDAAGLLEGELRVLASSRTKARLETISRQTQRIAGNCTACHARFRDNRLGK